MHVHSEYSITITRTSGFRRLNSSISCRYRQVLGGLMRRSEVLQDEALMREARAMDAAQQKVEIEALHGGFGMDALGDFLVAKIVDRSAL